MTHHEKDQEGRSKQSEAFVSRSKKVGEIIRNNRHIVSTFLCLSTLIYFNVVIKIRLHKIEKEKDINIKLN